MLAAVMPLPSEEVTPPVTKTYFAMGRVLRGFFQCYRTMGPGATCRGARRSVRHPPRPGSQPATPPTEKAA